MAAGPAVVRPAPADVDGLAGDAREPVHAHPAGSTFIDVLPAIVLFGLGISMVVAPLTRTLMGSIPAGTARAWPRRSTTRSQPVGQPLVAALIFVVVGATFYAALGALAGMDPRSADIFARRIQPLNPPPPGPPPAARGRCGAASVDAFHRAHSVSAALFWAARRRPFVLRGLRSARPDERAQAGRSNRRADRLTMPRDWDARTYDRVADPMTRWGAAVLDRLPLAATNGCSMPAAAAAG